jgi:acyl carrier protein
MSQKAPTSFESIRQVIIDYVLTNHPCYYNAETVPLDESLVELGVLDSYGVIELVIFLETNWSITIDESEITREKMGSINKMTNLILEKIKPIYEKALFAPESLVR